MTERASVQRAASALRRIAALRAGLAWKREKAGAVLARPPVLPPLLEWIPQLSPELASPVHLRPVTDAFESIHRGERIELCVSTPPRHGKTITALHGLVWLLAQHPDWPLLFVSYNALLAGKMVRKARKLAIRAGIPLGGVSRQDYWETAAGGGIRAAGMGGSLIGDGFRAIFVDDPHKNRSEAESPLIRQRVIDGFWSDIYTRQHPAGTSVVVNHQRWHTDDLIGTLTRGSDDPEGSIRPFDAVNLRAIDEAGRPLAPWMFDLDSLMRTQRRVGPHAWASMYQGQPIPRGGALFAAPTLTRSIPDTVRYSMGVDLARSAKQRSDHHAGALIARSPDGVCVIVDVVHARGTLTDRHIEGGLESGVARELRRLQQRCGGGHARWYAGRDETTLSDLLSGLRDPVYVRAMPADKDKWARAQAYAAAWNAGLVRVYEGCPHREELLRQHATFTGLDGDSDDLIDACVAAWDEAQVSPVARAHGLGERPMAAAMRARPRGYT